jgi:hypothetical protein
VLDRSSPLAPGLHVIVTKPRAVFASLLNELSSGERCLCIDMDGTATPTLIESGNPCVSALSSFDLPETLYQTISAGKGFRLVIFNSLNTLAELSRYKRENKTWMRDFYRNLLLVSTFCTSLAETVCYIQIIPEHRLERFALSWQSKVYQRLGRLWVYKGKGEFIRISYTTTRNRPL